MTSHSLTHRQEFNDRVLARISQFEGFELLWDRDTLVLHTDVHWSFFEEAVHVVWINRGGAFIARVIAAEPAGDGKIRLILSAFERFVQDVPASQQRTRRGAHLWARTSWRYLPAKGRVHPPRTLPQR